MKGLILPYHPLLRISTAISPTFPAPFNRKQAPTSELYFDSQAHFFLVFVFRE